MTVKDLAEQIKKKIIAWRREFHEYPELRWEEVRTGNRVAEELEKLGLEVRRVASTGVLGRVKGRNPGKNVALRADMDALPITEQTNVPYKSRHEGIMHACGHDGHTAMLLGAAEILSQLKNEIKGTVTLVFQPSEEGGGGAQKLLEEGVLEGVDGILGIHLWSPLPTGKVSLEPGPRMASADRFRLIVKGKGGHGATPHEAVDPIVAGSAIVMNLQSIVSREISPVEPSVITVGSIHGGDWFATIGSEVVMEGTTRSFNPAVRNLFPSLIERIAKETAEAYRAQAEVEYVLIAPPVINDQKMSEIAGNALSRLYGKEALIETEPSMTGEDFSYLCEAVPGVFAFVGCGNKEKGTDYPHHHEKFNIDEDSLPVGTSLYAQFALDFLKDGG